MNLIEIEVNGRRVEREIPARMHLADFVREEANLTGTHLGCEHGVCGACTVLIDGTPARSCITFAASCAGRKVRTIEGFEADPAMKLLRAAFSRHHALQCGYCTPGMLATARDIVLRLPAADEHRVRVELAGNLCRCTGYMGIVAAILDVLGQCRAGLHPDVEQLRSTSGANIGERKPGAVFAPFEARSEASQHSQAAAVGDLADAPRTGGESTISGSFTVPYPARSVWDFMTDLPAIAACLPGAELTEHEADRVKGRIAIKFGPISASFDGAARLTRDDVNRSAVLRGSGQDSLSQSRTRGDVAFRLLEVGPDLTRVDVDLEYALQGPLAQFSRSGLARDFVMRMIQEFGKNVGHRMDPSRSSGAPLPPAKLNAMGMVMSVFWLRLRRIFGGGGESRK